MLLLVDLDNTLIDRAAAFDAWATDFVRLPGLPESEAIWLIEADCDGYESRDSLARTIKGRFRLDMTVGDLVDKLLYEHVHSMSIETRTTLALTEVRESGWKTAILTNGTTAQQMRKIQKVSLERYVDAVVISETEGVKKPDVEIFRIAARPSSGHGTHRRLDGRRPPHRGYCWRPSGWARNRLGFARQGVVSGAGFSHAHCGYRRRGHRSCSPSVHTRQLKLAGVPLLRRGYCSIPLLNERMLP